MFKRLLLIASCLAVFASSRVLADTQPNPDSDDTTFISLTRRPDHREQLPTNTSVITAADIAKLGVTNVPDALRFIPGVKIEGSGSQGSFSNIKLRGVPSSNLVQILIDDQPLGGTSIQNIDASLIPIADVERIEVVRGGSSLYGANTVGGIIHIITKKARQPLAAIVSYEGQSFKTNIHTTQVEAKADHLDAIATYRRMDTNGYQDFSKVDQKYASAEAGYSFSNGSRLSLGYSDIDSLQDLTSGTPIPFEQWNGKTERQSNGADSTIDKDGRRVRAKGEVILPLGLVLNTGSYSSDKRETITPFVFARSNDEVWNDDTRLILNNGFTAGFDYERDQRHSLGQSPHHVTNIAEYIEQDFKSETIRVIPALRVEQHSLFGHQYNPRVAVVLTPTKELSLSGNAARTVRAPTITDLYENFLDTFGDPANDFHANPNLKPEIAWSYDAGIRLEPSDVFSTSVTGFYTHIKDRIAAIDSDGVLNTFGFTTLDTSANVSKAEISGAEVESRLKTGIVSQDVSYTYQRAKGTTATSTEFVDIRLTPRHILGYRVNVDLGRGLSLFNSVQYLSRQYEQDGRRGAVLHPHAVWNAKLEENTKSFSVFVGIDNVLNRLYGESVTFGIPVPQPTRTFKAGASLKFGDVR